MNNRDQRPTTLGISYLVMKFDGLNQIGSDLPSFRKDAARITMGEAERGLLGFIYRYLLASGFLVCGAKLVRRPEERQLS